MSAVVWYYIDGSGRTLGPVLTPAMRRLLKDGTIKPNTLIRCDEQEEWVRSIDCDRFQRTLASKTDSNTSSQGQNVVEESHALTPTIPDWLIPKSASTARPKKKRMKRNKDNGQIKSRIDRWLEKHANTSSQGAGRSANAETRHSQLSAPPATPSEKRISRNEPATLIDAADTVKTSADGKSSISTNSKQTGKLCSKCSAINFDDATQCRSCNADLFKNSKRFTTRDSRDSNVEAAPVSVEDQPRLRLLTSMLRGFYHEHRGLLSVLRWILIASIFVGVILLLTILTAWITNVVSSLSFPSLLAWTVLIPIILYFAWIKITDETDNPFLNPLIFVLVLSVVTIWLRSIPSQIASSSSSNAPDDTVILVVGRDRLESILLDPGSLEIIVERVEKPGRNGGRVGYYAKYRAKNGFGGYDIDDFYTE